MILERDRTALRKGGRDRCLLTRQTLLVKVIEKCETGILGGEREGATERGGGGAKRSGERTQGRKRGFMSNE